MSLRIHLLSVGQVDNLLSVFYATTRLPTKMNNTYCQVTPTNASRQICSIQHITLPYPLDSFLVIFQTNPYQASFCHETPVKQKKKTIISCAGLSDYSHTRHSIFQHVINPTTHRSHRSVIYTNSIPFRISL
jgi:hypothetical protein